MSKKDAIEQVLQIPLGNIVPSPYQPRKNFEENALRELADSIRGKGVIEPILLRSTGKDAFELIAGERRWRASKLAGKETIPAIVRQVSDEGAREIALIENLQRKDLTVMEEAESLQALLGEYGGNQQMVCERLGKSATYVNDRLVLLALPKQIHAYLDQGKLNPAQAKVILELDGEDAQLKAAEYAIKLNLTANELKGRMQRSAKPGARNQGNGSAATVTHSQISSILVRLFEAAEGYEVANLRDTNKRATLRKQVVLVKATLERMLAAIDSGPSADIEEEHQDPEETTIQ